LYRENAERSRVLEKAVSIEDFLQSLELHCDITPISSATLPRAAQLTQRTNQFNATTIRRNELQLQQFLALPNVYGHVVHVRDRFGDYGLVGVMIAVEHD